MSGAPSGDRLAKRWLVLPALALVLVPFAAVPLLGEDGEGEVPTARVELQSFQRRVPAEGNLEAVESTPISVPAGVNKPMRIAWLATDGSRVAAGDPVVRFDPTEVEKELVDALDDLRTSDLKAEKEQASRNGDLANLDRDARMARMEVEDSQRFQKKDELIFSRHEIVESEIDEELAEERLDHARKSRRTRESLSDAELELVDIERRKAAHTARQAEEVLAAAEITAPHDGLVVFRRDWRGEPLRVGETVWSGFTLAEIPDLGAMQAVVYVLEADAGGIAVGQSAEVVLEAHPGRTYAAEVKRVDNLAKPRLRGSPVQYFAVTLALDETVPELMKPGQRVRATIQVDDLAEALVVPRQAVFERDGANIVYRRSAGAGFEAVPVELGPAAMGRVVIASGLEAGDEVALTDPQRPAEEREPAGGGGGGGGGGLAIPGGTP
ncbi:MAG TPA: efflux RND transporter periplasmic adaptor subunit [Thermoanaerobaculia bacterium]|nr:efflux RND transporter periplasmic adaptor subunit [Thermoanaerobaculia bacterium]